MSESSLLFLAGKDAYREVRRDGFDPSRIGTLAGASGGAKWLVLSQLDRVLIEQLVPKLKGPIHLLGSSIGAWRHACYALAKPLDAIDRFEYAYLNQEYSDKPTRSEITTTTREILKELIGNEGAKEIVGNPLFRNHILTVRSRALLASDVKPVLATGLIVAAATNAVSRTALGAFFQRALFYDQRTLPPCYAASGFPLHQIPVSEQNLIDAILASGSIPLVLHGIRNIAGAPEGCYRDGGIIDYHLDLPVSDNGRLTLLPHFYPHLIPGWFDKNLSRRASSAHHSRTIVICPAPEFVARLPNGKIPDRTDFKTMTPNERRRNWRRVIASCGALASELSDVLASNRLAARIEPL